MRRFVLLFLALLAPSTHAKKISGNVKLSSQNTEQYMAKFSFSPYVSSYIYGEFRVYSGQYFDQHPHALVLCLYNETQWRKFQDAMKGGSLCVDRQRLASWTTDRIHPSHQQDGQKFMFESHLRAPHSRAHYWFAALMDCYLEEYDAHPPPLHYDITFLNGKSHLPADETGMISINLIAFLCMGAYGVFFFGIAMSRMRKAGQIHLITVIFLAAYALQTFSVFCELMHLRRFAHDGKGLRWRHTYFALDFLSGLSQSISELILSVLLIALAFGWTLGLASQEPISGIPGKILGAFHRPALILRGLQHPSSILLFSIGLLQFLLLAWGRAQEEDFNNFHDFEHLPGLLLLGIRLLMCGLFLWALKRSKSVEGGQEILGFLDKLMWFGGVWFLCLPILILLAMVLPPYRRHQLVAGGSIFVQGIALSLLSTLFLESSEFYKISSLNHVGQALPSLSSFSGMGKKPKIAVD